MKQWLCWLHEHETEEDADVVDAHTNIKAAEEKASAAWYDESFEGIEVRVRPKEGGDYKTFYVEVEYEPEFFAVEI